LNQINEILPHHHTSRKHILKVTGRLAERTEADTAAQIVSDLGNDVERPLLADGGGSS